MHAVPARSAGLHSLQEKEAQARLDPRTRALSTALRDLAEQGDRRFLIDRDHSCAIEAPLDLLDQRVIHLMGRGVGPRGQYDLFALDLGMFSDILAERHRCPHRLS